MPGKPQGERGRESHRRGVATEKALSLFSTHLITAHEDTDSWACEEDHRTLVVLRDEGIQGPTYYL